MGRIMGVQYHGTVNEHEMNIINKAFDGRVFGKVVINNVPDTARRYIVARLTNGELWFWGSWDELDRANDCMDELNEQNDNAIVVEKE